MLCCTWKKPLTPSQKEHKKRKSAFLVHQQISQFVVNNSVQFILKGTNEFNCVCVTEYWREDLIEIPYSWFLWSSTRSKLCAPCEYLLDWLCPCVRLCLCRKVLPHKTVMKGSSKLFWFLQVYCIWMNLILMGLVPSILLIVLNSLMLRSLIGHLRDDGPPTTAGMPTTITFRIEI